MHFFACDYHVQVPLEEGLLPVQYNRLGSRLSADSWVERQPWQAKAAVCGRGKVERLFLLWALSEPASLARLWVPKWLFSWNSHGEWGKSQDSPWKLLRQQSVCAYIYILGELSRLAEMTQDWGQVKKRGCETRGERRKRSQDYRLRWDGNKGQELRQRNGKQKIQWEEMKLRIEDKWRDSGKWK